MVFADFTLVVVFLTAARRRPSSRRSALPPSAPTRILPNQTFVPGIAGHDDLPPSRCSVGQPRMRVKASFPRIRRFLVNSEKMKSYGMF
ncbi:hypothetical protein EWN99_21295 [Salmonella enterica]|nr:hypothetical protein [Salmonella enterica]EBN6689471.1 hypothetical protein [Salmonella enterica]EGU8718974.1 hypothetical protein [Salmonella enterica]